MSLDDRARFLRHLRPWWDVHRHRIPGLVADRFDAARQSGQLRLHTGRIIGYDSGREHADVYWRPRGAEQPKVLRVARVINCSGPDADYARMGDALVRCLLAQGTARPDALRLGLDITHSGALIGADGGVSRRIFAVGPVTKGMFWEMTAVPDIRRQCEVLAQHLAGLVAVRGGAEARPQAFSFAV
jgi:uncharacterized NAD(P)/FAD-binding protein YdhS